MKAIRTIGLWKAIAFLTVVISLFSCAACDPDLGIKPQVTIGQAENIKDYSATLVGQVIPNGEASAAFSYQAGNSDWVTSTSIPVFNEQSAKVTLDLYELQSGTTYRFTLSAKNKVGSTTSDTISFTTTGILKTVKSIVVLNQATDITKTSAKISAVVVPNQESEVSFEYQVENSTWVRTTLPSKFKGIDSVKVSFDLSDLQLNTNYNFRVISNNIAGEVVSSIGSFQTYAVSDYDGNLYHMVTIGAQTWLKENFKGTHYANGDAIPNVTSLDDWSKLTTGAYCYYDNNPENGRVYGGLYNFWVGVDPRGLIAGWHTPTSDEFRILRIFVDNGDVNTAGIKMMEVGGAHWESPKRIANNSSSFTALPGGANEVNSATMERKFQGLKRFTSFWGTSVIGPYANSPYIDEDDCFFVTSGYDWLVNGFSLRLIKN